MKNSRILRKYWAILYRYLKMVNYNHYVHFNLPLYLRPEGENSGVKAGRLSFVYIPCRGQMVEFPEHVECAYYYTNSTPLTLEPKYFPKSILGDEEAFSTDHNTDMVDIEKYIDNDFVVIDWGFVFQETMYPDKNSKGFWGNTQIDDYFTLRKYNLLKHEIKTLFNEI